MNPVKVRIVGLALVDLATDVVVPLVVTLALTAVGVSSFLALSAAGVLVGGKVALGRLEAWRADRRAAAVLGAVVLALALLAGLAAAGVPDVVAAAAAGVVVVVPVVHSLLSDGRRLDGAALLVLAEIVASVVVTLVSDDPRFLLARPAVYTAVAGVAALVTCVRGRPLMLDATKPMAAGGDPVRAAAFEAAWEHDAAFRRVERWMTASLGVVLLLEAVLRVVVVYGSSTPEVAMTGLFAQVPGIVPVLAWFVGVRVLAVPRASRAVDRFMPAPVPACPR
ncbi:VC0807 family protein [Actinomycetospora sp. CA-084318]|uniref:VC0807 family protein n=1 Tax=Actinomycetospora sp. CA-084318 TaxID=3239892 RepID=UPI003D956C15